MAYGSMEYEGYSFQARKDAQTRRRYEEHERWETRQGRRGRMAESTAALKRNKGGYDSTAWHTYVHQGGTAPSDFRGGGAAPTMGGAPTYEKPEYDESKVSALTQKRAAPGVRRLREVTQRAMGATYENPNVKRMTVRSALAGYGTGLESVMAGAGTTARAEYGQEYAADVAGSMATFRGQLDRRTQEFDVSSREYLMGRETEYWKQRQDYESDPYADFEAFYR